MPIRSIVALATVLAVEGLKTRQQHLLRRRAFAKLEPHAANISRKLWETIGAPDGDSPAVKEPMPKWHRPFNLTNGACRQNPDKERYVMEIQNVAGGSYYIGKMGFGSPPQELNMLLDTGSDEIVVKGDGCRNCEGVGFNPQKSSTWKIQKPQDDPHHGTESISYGSGDVYGQRGLDTVSTGPLSGPNMEILVVQATNVQAFADTSSTALHVIAGMAPGLPEYTGEKLASHMEVRRFSQCLPQNSDENGFFVVNDDNPSAKGFYGPFKSVGNYYWALGVTDFRMEWTPSQPDYKTEKPRRLGTMKQYSTLVDTGTTLLSVPQSVLDDLEAALDGLAYDCAQMERLPHLSFEVGGITHRLPPNTYIAEETGEYLVKTPDGDKDKAIQLKIGGNSEAETVKYKDLYFRDKTFVNKLTGQRCVLLFTAPIQMSGIFGEIGILGMPFFRNYILSFDFCTREIFTKRSSGDCHHAVGKSPSNKHYCADGDWVGCLGKDVSLFFTDMFEGFASIFMESKPPSSGPRLKLQPGMQRISKVARWLLSGKKDAIVEL